jgi:hypothetical protein
MADNHKHNPWYLALGSVVILGCLALCVLFIHLAYVQLFPPGANVVSLAAYFVNDSGDFVPQDPNAYGKTHLKILGSVSTNGEPVSGMVRITVSSGHEPKQAYFRQSVSVPVQRGRFETDDPAFRAIRPAESIQIDADVNASGRNSRSSIVLNTPPPADRTAWEVALIGICLLLAVVFLWAFTGKRTAGKNQTAIIFSYVVIALFLAVPVVAPNVLLRLFPESVEAMIGAPAGLVNTHTANEDIGKTQWALNIGGYSFQPLKPAPAVVARFQASSKNGDPAASGDSRIAGDNSPASSTDAQVAPATATPLVDSDPPGPTETIGTSGTAARFGPNAAGSLVAPVVEVQGGLVIPLYVIILSVMGGAINMTRKVPRFQQEGEASAPSSGGNIRDLILTAGQTLAGGASRQAALSETKAESKPTEREPTPEEQAQVIHDLLDPLVTEQVLRNSQTEATLNEISRLVAQMQDLFQKTDANTLLGFGSFEDWAASHPRVGQLVHSGWRIELLNQYMYLISAPFLAVVTYYILDLLGLSKQGVVVVLSFSVGLISEKIVSWILGIATGYMRSDTAGTTPDSARFAERNQMKSGLPDADGCDVNG